MKLSSRAATAFSLVEVVIALGVASFCLVPIIGVIAVGSNSTQTSNSETQATHLMSQVVADLQVAAQATPAPTMSPFYQITMPVNTAAISPVSSTAPTTTLYLAADGSTSMTGTGPGTGALYRVSLGFGTPAAATGLTPGATVRIVVSWPAFADPSPAAWASKYSGSVETVFVLDKN